MWRIRSSHRKCSVRTGVARIFTKFTEKHLCQGLFFNKVAGLRQLYWKRDSGTGVSLWILRNFSKSTFFTDHLWATASLKRKKWKYLQSFCRNIYENMHHCIKYQNFTKFLGVKNFGNAEFPQSFRQTARNPVETCASTKFPHQEIR